MEYRTTKHTGKCLCLGTHHSSKEREKDETCYNCIHDLSVLMWGFGQSGGQESVL